MPNQTDIPDEPTLHSDRRGRVEATERPARIALAHDWTVVNRGGEAVLERLAAAALNLGNPASLYTLFNNNTPIGEATDRFERTPSWLNTVPGGKRAFRRWLLPLYPTAIGSLSAKLAKDHAAAQIDLLLSTSSGLIKGLQAPTGVPHLCYCHAPARWIWSIQDEYTQGGIGGAMRKLGFAMFTKSLRNWDRKTSSNVTRFLANSRHTAAEVERCFSRDATVLHPPVNTDFYTPDPNVQREGFWLFCAALEPYKRADLAIQAAMLAGKRLIIAGTGTALPQIKKEAKRYARILKKQGMAAGRDKLVTFAGRVSDESLRDLYRRAELFLFPQIEDFGITAVEAQACGCPVLARRAGGALDTVLEGRTGVFFNKTDPREIIKAAKAVPSVPEQCRASAERFSTARFDRKAAEIVKQTLDL